MRALRPLSRARLIFPHSHIPPPFVKPTSNKSFRILPGILSTIRMSSTNTSKQHFARTTGATDPVWVHKHPFDDHPRFSPLRSDTKTDVCVVGAGIAGISLAYELVSRGRDVVLLEAREVLSGETGRTSGHLSNALDDHYTALRAKHGAEGAQAAADSHTWALHRVGDIAKELGIACEYRHVDAYEISQYPRGDDRRDRDMLDLRREAEAARELGLSVSFRDDLTVRGWDGGPDQRGGTAFANQAAFHPTLYLTGILQWLQSQPNFQCFTNTRVMSVQETSSGLLGTGEKSVKVETADGFSVECAYAAETTLIPLQKLSVVGEMAYLRTYALAIRVPKGSVEDCFIYDSAEPYKYVRLTECDDRDDYLIIGGCDHRVGQDTPEGRYAELEDWVRERFTKAGSVDYRWSGQINEPVDYVGFIGKNQGCERVYVATGDSGNGLTHGVIASKLIADSIDGKSNEWTRLYDPKRLASIAKSAPTVVQNVLAINKEYKRFLQSDIADIEDLAPGCGGVLNPTFEKPVAVYKDEAGNVTKMSALCPHMKGVVCWNPGEKTFDCPVHGSRFSNEGECLTGPAKAGLQSVE